MDRKIEEDTSAGDDVSGKHKSKSYLTTDEKCWKFYWNSETDPCWGTIDIVDEIPHESYSEAAFPEWTYSCKGHYNMYGDPKAVYKAEP